MSERTVFVIDDNVRTLETLGQVLRSIHFEVTCFIRPSKCIERLSQEDCDLVIVDVATRGSSGADLLAQVVRTKSWIPVLALIEVGDVKAAVTAVRAGVADIVERPVDKEALKATVRAVMRENTVGGTLAGSPLTGGEITVLKLIIADKTNSEMAHLLGRSVRTIEWRRANIMKKLGVESLVGLIRRSAELGIVNLNARHRV